MPEMPEVETVRRQLEPGLTGRTITAIWVDRGPRYGDVSAAVGRTVLRLARRGKYLLADLGASTLVLHLGMSGRLALLPAGAVPDRFVRARFTLDDGQDLVFSDMRRFGTMGILGKGAVPPWDTLRTMGPEPFSEAFTADALHSALKHARRTLKAQLLSQRPVAGLGNIYVDESLHRAGLHPRQRNLSKPAATRLHRAIIEVLHAAVEARGTTFQLYRDGHGGAGDFYRELRVFDRAGLPCHACGTTIVKEQQEGRGTHWCPGCQPPPRKPSGRQGRRGVS
ncbi:MAG: bifunctional DNA-formamidopyrimidine glycosylase/DNA-(apurinic or apyrimidinic site) lyase [Candidatus Sericytochromatia bacterium]|nr:bifunctional DNA-formamidopyrimidine glycosylase/DNA-(apurinic or apyrimidinic site) lyase [Candidatus Tanganyikabacteria bacterium]